jgi:O-antigen/teichoic acid export membrane protein
MINKKVRNDTILTIFSKSVIVLINFIIVVCVTRYWGAEGKGYHALFTANLALITIVTNIFTNSTISFFVRKVGASKLYLQATLWTFISSSFGVLIFYFVDHSTYLFLLLIACILTGYITFHNALYIGMQRIKYFNFLTILQPLFLLLFMYLLNKITDIGYFIYFYASILSLISVIIIAHFFTRKTVGKMKMCLDFSVTKQCFNYGFQNELSGFLQFLANRLSYYFIVYYLCQASLGIFSLGVAISESILLISRSISMVQYSKIISDGNTLITRKGVVTASIFSIGFTFFCLVVILLFPNELYTYVFTKEFVEIKKIILLMCPGILCSAFSNVYGHYFAAIKKMKILLFKSAVGLLLTLILSIVLIPLWKMNGACIISSFVRFLSAAIIIVFFFFDKSKEEVSKITNNNIYD